MWRMELLGTCDLQEHALCDVLVKTGDYAYFVVGKGSVLSRFRIRLSVLNQHPSTLVALLAGADTVRVGGNITHILRVASLGDVSDLPCLQSPRVQALTAGSGGLVRQGRC